METSARKKQTYEFYKEIESFLYAIEIQVKLVYLNFSESQLLSFDRKCWCYAVSMWQMTYFHFVSLSSTWVPAL